MPAWTNVHLHFTNGTRGQRAAGKRPLKRKGVLTMNTKLQGKKIAIVATDGFEQVELTEPKKALEAAGATVEVISPKPGQIKGWNHTDWGENTKVDKTLDEAKPADYDGLVLPGGQINPDKLRIEP